MKKLTILLTAMTFCCLTCFGQAEKITSVICLLPY